MGTRRPIVSALCATFLNCNECTEDRNMRVAHCRPATPKTPRQSPYFHELEPFSSKLHPGWMHLFKHTDAQANTGDPKVARRSHSALARPQGVLDLMENSWCVARTAVGLILYDVYAYPVEIQLPNACYHPMLPCGARQNAKQACCVALQVWSRRCQCS